MLLNTQSILAERRFAPVKAFAVAPSRIVSILAGRPVTGICGFRSGDGTPAIRGAECT